MTPVHNGDLPDGLDSGFTGPPPPWMGGVDFAAVLFYADDPANPAISPKGKMPDGRNTKILWLIRNSSGPLTLRGTETKGKTFTQEIEGGGFYPSIVEVPSVGCWNLQASLGGRAVGSITLRAK